MSVTLGFQVGQRVVNEAEPKLGLGVILECTRREVRVRFVAVEEDRVYRVEGAPLRRFALSPGQKARSREGSSFVVTAVAQDQDGLLVYRGEAGQELSETQLSDEAPRAGALEHLESLQLGPFQDFELRAQAYQLQGKCAAHPGRGLVGPRVALLSHQLFVASKALQQRPVRYLLADEVGLGKTIEAGLIASGLHAVGEAETLLVVVPQPLKHQWLAEFYRRFNLTLEIYEPEAAAPQLKVLASYEELAELSEFSWELAIVDEAHHLSDSPDLERLSRNSRDLLLLSATPARSGEDGWWRLCRLVDPGRYPDRQGFQEMHQELEHLSTLAAQIESGEKEPSAALELFPEDTFLNQLVKDGADKAQVLDHLVDRHGTGRILIRNRRPRLSHLFSGRELLPVATEDRFQWLKDYLLSGERKTLLICSAQETVVELYEELRKELPVSLGTFHEGMSLLERDRQAAYFAEPEGAQMLLASEIGSEGRNFQFASDLILYDLPKSPDLLEQRIGRLDRIGQTERVRLHVPYESGAEETLLRWHQTLGSFEGPVPGGQRLLQRFGSSLDSEVDWEAVTAAVSEERERARREVDVLIDRNSFRPEAGEALANGISELDRDPELPDFLPVLLERFGVLCEELEVGHFLVRPGDMMFVDSLPGLPNESGLLGTFDRELALVREDLDFFTLEHPMVAGTLEMLLDQPESRASAARWRPAPETTIALQMLFVFEAAGPSRLHLPRYLRTRPFSLTVSMDGRCRPDLEEALEPGALTKLPPEVTAELLNRLGEKLRALVEVGRAQALEQFESQRQEALASARSELARELDRRRRLAEFDPSLSLAEFSADGKSLLEHLGTAEPRLDTIRLLLCQAQG